MHTMYHMVPEPMLGTTLMPLNAFKESHPDIYERGARKYRADPTKNRRDRSSLMQRRIPFLKCLWNDVVHSSAVHPSDLMYMWREAGYVPAKPLRMFEIPIAMLDRNRILIYKNQRDYLKRAYWNYERYDPSTYERFTEISDKARRTMKKLVAKNQIWHFLHITHVLYQGPIETKDLQVITVHP